MLVDVFALLTESRERTDATVNSVEAKRDFWLAYTDLDAAMLGGVGPGASAETVASAAVTEWPPRYTHRRPEPCFRRRNFLTGSAVVLAGASMVSGRTQAARDTGSSDQ